MNFRSRLISCVFAIAFALTISIWAAGCGCSEMVVVSFDLQGGYLLDTTEDTLEDISIREGHSFRDDGKRFPTNICKDGYVFDGWYDSPTGGTKYTKNTNILSDTTLYAHWRVDG